MRIAQLCFDVYSLVSVDRIHDRRQNKSRRIRPRKPAIAVRGPLHGCANSVAVAEMQVVAHTDFIAVIDNGSTRHREQQTVHQLDAAAIILQ